MDLCFYELQLTMTMAPLQKLMAMVLCYPTVALNNQPLACHIIPSQA
jgi:hypothetical protein